MLFNMLLANMGILLCFFFLLLFVFNRFFTISEQIKNARLKLALNIRTGALMTVANDVIEILSVVTDITVNDLYNDRRI